MKPTSPWFAVVEGAFFIAAVWVALTLLPYLWVAGKFFSVVFAVCMARVALGSVHGLFAFYLERKRP